MCFNKESSFFTWLVAFIIGIVLLQKGAYWKALFLLTFSLIQLLEAIIWFSIENKNYSLNSNTTKLVLIALWLQPIVNCVCAFHFGHVGYFKYLLIGLLLVFLNSLYRIFSSEHFESIVGPTGHLVWTSKRNKIYNSFLGPEPSNILYFVALCLPIFYMQNNIGPLIVMGTTVSWSYYNYWTTREFSSMWCFSAASLAIVYSLFE